MLVDAVDLEIGAGRRWGLIGASGAGKSLTGLFPPGVRAEGSVRVAGTVPGIARHRPAAPGEDG